MKWSICFADREYERECTNGKDLGQVEARTREEALEKARQDAEISRRTFGHCCELWAYPAKQQSRER